MKAATYVALSNFFYDSKEANFKIKTKKQPIISIRILYPTISY